MADARDHLHVAVNGATGFLGTHVVAALAEAGHRAVALVRENADPRNLDVLESLGAKIARVDLTDEPALTDAMRGCARLVHLIGSIAPKKGTKFDDLHRGMAERSFRAAAAAGVEKAVMVTALGAGPDAPSMYHRTKWQAEEALRRSGLAYVVLRPSLIVGRRVGRRDSKMVRRYIDLIETKPKVPLVLGGRNRVQPIDVVDLAKAIVEATVRPDWDGRTLELGGGEVMTTREFVGRIMQAIGEEKPCKAIPGPLAWCAATILEMLQDTPLLSRDQLRIAGMDGTCEPNALTEAFGIEPRPLDESLAVYRAEKGPPA